MPYKDPAVRKTRAKARFAAKIKLRGPLKANCAVCNKEYHKLDKSITCSKACAKTRRYNKANLRNRNLYAVNPAKFGRNPVYQNCVICSKEFRKFGKSKTCGEVCSTEYTKKYIRNKVMLQARNRRFRGLTLEQKQKDRARSLRNYYNNYEKAISRNRKRSSEYNRQSWLKRREKLSIEQLNLLAEAATKDKP